MRIGYAVAVAALLAATPAMAQLTITGGSDPYAAQQHQYQCGSGPRRRAAEYERGPRRSGDGDYGAAERDQDEAHQDWHAAQHQEQAAERDSGGVTVQLGR